MIEAGDVWRLGAGRARDHWLDPVTEDILLEEYRRRNVYELYRPDGSPADPPERQRVELLGETLGPAVAANARRRAAGQGGLR